MTDEAGPLPPEQPRRRAPNLLLIVALAAFAAGLVAMALAARWWMPSAGTGTDGTPTAQSAPPAPGSDATPSAISGDPVALAARADTLAARIAQLEGRLDEVDTGSRTASGFASRAEGLMVAFAARRALDRGLALGYVEDQLRLRFSESEPQAVAIVVQNARSPVTLADLREALAEIAPSLLRTDLSEGWWTAVKRSLSALVVIRQASTPNPRPSERLDRARLLLGEGQVEGAIGEISRMPGAANAESWTRAAQRYVAARRALDRIETAAIQGQGRILPPPIVLPDPSLLPEAGATPVPAPAPTAAP